VVADAWRVLPVADGSIDVVLDVFAPRNAGEFARVLAPGGVLVTVTPEPDHLLELRVALGLLDIQPGKHEQLEATLNAAELVEVSHEHLHYPCRLDGAAVRDLIAMGPNAFHMSATDIDERAAWLSEPVVVTVAVDLTLWTRSD
jgi:23S rRNA (guanine745-N1)-methyltransferase